MFVSDAYSRNVVLLFDLFFFLCVRHANQAIHDVSQIRHAGYLWKRSSSPVTTIHDASSAQLSLSMESAAAGNNETTESTRPTNVRAVATRNPQDKASQSCREEEKTSEPLNQQTQFLTEKQLLDLERQESMVFAYLFFGIDESIPLFSSNHGASPKDAPPSSELLYKQNNTHSAQNKLQPQPQSFVDDRIDPSGHVWRSHYCVLEHGALFMYRQISEAERPDASIERQQYADSTNDNHEDDYYSNNINNHNWESVITLNRVDAVRSVELEHGQHTFALSFSTEDETTSLRAHNAKDMNEWIFQFHRVMTSFVMDRMMACSAHAASSNDQEGLLVRSYHHHQGVLHTRTGANVSPDHYHRIHSMHLSPRVGEGAMALSHGHGRNRLHRKRLSEQPSLGLAQSPQDTTLLEFSDMAEPPERLQSLDLSPIAHHVSTRLLEIDTPPELCAPQSNYPETERPPAPKPGKYIPPQLRKQTPASSVRTSLFHSHVPESAPTCAGTAKYVPPHMRARAGVQNVPSELEAKAAIEPVTVMPIDDEALDIVEDWLQLVGGFKRGGCADPTLMNGSVLDPIYIPRKASMLGKTHTEPFGCISSENLDNTLRWEIGAVSECGVRESNEDSFLIAPNLNKALDGHGLSSHLPAWPAAMHTPSLFAVFDGHCGNHAARFAAEHLVQYIHEYSLLESDENMQLGAPDRVDDILRQALYQMDMDFCNACVQEGRDWESGATALVAALVEEQLVIANLGDCQGVMCCSVDPANDGAMIAMDDDGWLELPSADCPGEHRCFWKKVTNTHSPSRKDEHERIQAANGWITTETEIPIGQLQRMDLFDQDVIDILKRCFGDRIEASQKAAAPQRILHISRVCGELAVSRALGDRDFKAAFNGLKTHSSEHEWVNESLCLPYPDDHTRAFVGDLVSNKPDVQILPVGEPGVSEEFLLLACDGLWDVMDPDDAVRVARNLLFERKWSAKRAANRLAELAVHLGSSDNITLILVRFFERN
jgi:serine/threonine protein phosphatase PrpC